MKPGEPSEPPGTPYGLFQLHPTLDALPTFIYVKDSARRVVSANRSFCGALGVTREELIGKSSAPLLGDAGPESDRVDEEVLATGVPCLGFVEWYMAPSGRRWVLTDKAPIRDADGNVVGLLGTSIDITAHREADQRLKRSEAQLRFVTEHVSDILWTMDLDFRLTFVSPSVERVLGFSLKECYSQTLEQMVAPESAHRIRTELDRQLLSLRSDDAPADLTVTVEAEMYHKNGGTIWMEVRVGAVRDESGKVVGLVGVSRDITTRKQTEQKLQESTRLLREAELLSKTGGWSYDVATGASYWSDGVFAIYEMEPGVGADLSECSEKYYPPAAWEKVWAAFTRAVEEGEPYDLEVPFISAKGTPRWIRTIGRPQVVDGTVVRITGNIMDLTEQHRGGEALRASEEKYRQLFEQSVDAVNLVAPDGSLLEANPAWHALFGYTPDDSAGFSAVRAYVETNGRKKFLREIASTDRLEDEIQLRRKDGSVFDCHRVVLARRGSDGTVVGYQTVFHDVTERKRTQQALMESEARYRQIFDQSLVPISVITPDGRIIEANDAWLNLFGYSREEVFSLAAVNLFRAPEDRQMILESMLR